MSRGLVVLPRYFPPDPECHVEGSKLTDRLGVRFLVQWLFPSGIQEMTLGPLQLPSRFLSPAQKREFLRGEFKELSLLAQTLLRNGTARGEIRYRTFVEAFPAAIQQLAMSLARSA